MKSKLAISRELQRVEELRKKPNLSLASALDMRGAQQALSWVLEQNAAAPSTCVYFDKRKAVPDAH